MSKTTRSQNVAPQIAYHVRWMIRRDMPEVLALEAGEYNPWTEENFLSALRQRNCIGMVAEQAEVVVGYMIYELHRSKFELLKVVADQDQPSIFSAALRKLTSKLSSHRRTRVGYYCDERALDLQLLLKNEGWDAIRVIRKDDGADSFRFVFRIPACVVEI